MVKLKCHRCNHVWDYSGNKIYPKCPSCYTSVKARSFNSKLDVKPEPAKKKGKQKMSEYYLEYFEKKKSL